MSERKPSLVRNQRPPATGFRVRVCLMRRRFMAKNALKEDIVVSSATWLNRHLLVPNWGINKSRETWIGPNRIPFPAIL